MQRPTEMSLPLCKKKKIWKDQDVLAPFRRPFCESSNAAFVINLKADVRTPDAARPAKKD
jgi:hypothetical protein